MIKRSINSPFTFDRHSRFLVVTREQTWESLRDKKLRIGTFHLLEELRSVKRNKLPSEGGLMGQKFDTVSKFLAPCRWPASLDRPEKQLDDGICSKIFKDILKKLRKAVGSSEC